MGMWRRVFWGRPRTGGSGAFGELVEALQPSRAFTVAEAQADRAGVYGDHRQSDGSAHLVHAQNGPPWLPSGSRAEVWATDVAPEPTGLVRLLLRRDDHVFCVPREDGRIDLPTRTVPADDPDGSITATRLAHEVLGRGSDIPRPVGFVRNVVPEPTPDYPWPSPIAHFTVWAITGEPAVPGQWVPVAPDSQLRDRHWFPLV